MNRDWQDQPEASGPLSESDLGQAQYGQPGYPTIGKVYPPAGASWTGTAGIGADPSAEAIRRTLAAERAADAGKQVPADATVIS